MQELRYQIALTMIPKVGPTRAKALVNHFGSASAIFKARRKELEAIEGLGIFTIGSILHFNNFSRAEEEMAYIEKHKITPLFITDKTYPRRLLNCYDNPVLLYYKGNADLNASKIVAIVGTRNATDYGKQVCETLVKDLAAEGVLIVSGLAFGIDAIAHRSALKNNLQTIGVLGHGLDRIYPAENRPIAKQMLSQGGLLSEFTANAKLDPGNFPSRNRIVAGISDCIIVIESGLKGGSLITAELGNGYNRDVFAIPGRIGDQNSAGCNYLIRSNKAGLLTSARELLENMGWEASGPKKATRQRQLFIELTPDEKVVIEILKTGEPVHIDELCIQSQLKGSSVAQSLLMLEMQGVIQTLPGKMYQLI